MDSRRLFVYIVPVQKLPPELKTLLKRYFGYDEFRPLQAEIIAEALAGRDVLALLPTGGGKSLCFQLPALALPGLTVVISPLIALMKDQVDALTASGVPATFLNSSLSPAEARERMNALDRGEFKLLYVAPERLVMSGFFDRLARWKLSMIAVDEAHCISEWGHDFRPEYRQLALARERFADLPVMALTATATERVRDDIVKQLRLRDARRFVASFNRPNLTYRVAPKAGAYEGLLRLIRARKNDAGIVYCLSRKGAEHLAMKLSEDGIKAAAYHAGIDPQERSRQQEKFLRDDVRVICATIAFGMGINKSNVRFVVHYDLPKNVEGYYQETGRAGRDGLPGECVLFFSPGDRMKQLRFIDDISDPKEKERALAQLELMVHYAEGADCRRRYLLNYFGEEFDEPSCNGCDNCLSPRETWDATVSAQKFLSCVYRIQEKSGFGMGISHVAEVLTGAKTEKVRKFGHDTISTYGIGKEHDRTEWATIGRELVRLGLLKQDAARFNALQLSAEGRGALRSRQKVALTRAIQKVESKHREGEIECDEVLFERLRELRKKVADERSVPAYVIFSDVTLRHMSREYPTAAHEFARISGVGERKSAELGHLFTAEIAAYLEEHPRQVFTTLRVEKVDKPRATGSRITPTVIETLEMFWKGMDVAEIAKRRGFVTGTIYGHLATAIDGGKEVDIRRVWTAEEEREIAGAVKKFGFNRDAIEVLGGRFEYGHLKLYRAYKGQSARTDK